jgi:hypothetical protein
MPQSMLDYQTPWLAALHGLLMGNILVAIDWTPPATESLTQSLIQMLWIGCNFQSFHRQIYTKA